MRRPLAPPPTLPRQVCMLSTNTIAAHQWMQPKHRDKRAKVRERQTLRKARRIDDAKNAEALEQAMPANISVQPPEITTSPHSKTKRPILKMLGISPGRAGYL